MPNQRPEAVSAALDSITDLWVNSHGYRNKLIREYITTLEADNARYREVADVTTVFIKDIADAFANIAALAKEGE